MHGATRTFSTNIFISVIKVSIKIDNKIYQQMSVELIESAINLACNKLFFSRLRKGYLCYALRHLCQQVPSTHLQDQHSSAWDMLRWMLACPARLLYHPQIRLSREILQDVFLHRYKHVLRRKHLSNTKIAIGLTLRSSDRKSRFLPLGNKLSTGQR